ncbi:MAG: protein kinase [Acidobacteria bacterium]|nr:protein kinase [Acidobacteriota bacterium]
MPLATGTRLGRYEVIRLLGAGGMGEVYLVKDERLEREVALKVLPTGTLADESARKRFRREALALSKLNHPNIETVYDFDTEDGTDFLVMEYVAGQTLEEKLADGALPEKEVVTLGGQVASALEEAHEQGVVHRDLKPGNIIVTSKGQTKLLDFGLARLLEPVAEGSQVQTISQSGSTVGTMPYMAPEQLRAEKVDARTDIFALGAVLYEMATGQRTFKGDSSPQVTDAILHQAPVTPRALNAQVSPDLERIVLKCLEKDPALRYQTAKEVGVDLRRLGIPSGVTEPAVPVSPGIQARAVRLVAAIGAATVIILLVGVNVGGVRDWLFGGGGPAHIESIAVLPLENLSGDPEQEFFVDGMTDALITALSKIRALKVISRTSSMRYKSEDRPPLPEIASELGVDAVIEGSVLRVGNRVRITAQLIEAATDQHLWAESYDRDLRDILTLQGNIAQAIAREIRVELAPQDKARLASPKTVDPEVYRLYLLGRHHSKNFTQEGFNKASEYLKRAIQLDPDYAPAHAWLSWTHMASSDWLFSPTQAKEDAKVAATRALELDETLAIAHSALGWNKLFYDYDWSAAEKEFKRALELNPGESDAHAGYAWCLFSKGRTAEAVVQVERGLELDPLSVVVNFSVGLALHFNQQYDQAVEQLQKAVELHPNNMLSRGALGMVLEQKGKWHEAISQFEMAREVSNDNPWALAYLGHAFGASGQEEKASGILRELEQLSTQRYVSGYDIALVHAGMGNKQEALAWLERAYKDRSDWIVWLKVDPRFDPLRGDPQFQKLIQRVGFPSS